MIVIPVVVRTTEDMLLLVPEHAARGRASRSALPRWLDDHAHRLPRRARRHHHRRAAGHRAHQPARPRRCCSPRSTTSSGASNLNEPMASLPVVIFQFALSPYEDWQQLAWAGALLITLAVLALNIVARAAPAQKIVMTMQHPDARIAARRRRHADGRRSRSATSNFYYGEYQALKDINLDIYENKVTAFIGPSGCGKSTLLRIFNRMYELYPEPARRRRDPARRREHPDAEAGPEPAARPHRHGVPEADAVPDVDLRQHRLRRPPLREPAAQPSMDERVEMGAAQRGAVGRGQGQARRQAA